MPSAPPSPDCAPDPEPKGRPMKPLLPLASALTLVAAVATADEFTDTIRAPSRPTAPATSPRRADLEYTGKLLTAMKSESLAKFLPAAPAGWTREDAAGDAEASGMMGMFGGGTAASATYRRGSEEMTLNLIANSPMITGMAGMLSGIAAMGGGKPMRIQRTEFAMNEQICRGWSGARSWSASAAAPRSRTSPR